MDLFDYMRQTNQEKEAPLAARLRPRTLDEVVGQQHIIGKDKLLYRAIQADKLSSIIFYGPPGTGKTTLARVIANTTSAEFMQINATVAGKKDMEEVVAKAKDNRGMFGKKTILFIDEIHRFNKSQQDYLLPFVEDGTLILIGATTENPYFEVNGALLSRSVIFELKPLSKEDIEELIRRAVYDQRGMGAYQAQIEPDALEFLADIAGGDARAALNAVELGVMTTQRSEEIGAQNNQHHCHKEHHQRTDGVLDGDGKDISRSQENNAQYRQDPFGLWLPLPFAAAFQQGDDAGKVNLPEVVEINRQKNDGENAQRIGERIDAERESGAAGASNEIHQQ